MSDNQDLSNVECLNLTKLLISKYPANQEEVETYYINKHWKVLDYKEVEKHLKEDLEKNGYFISDRRTNIENNLKALDRIKVKYLQLSDEDKSKLLKVVSCQKMINSSQYTIKLDELVSSFDNFGNNFRSDLYSRGNKLIIQEFGLENEPSLIVNEDVESRLSRFKSKLFALISLKIITTKIIDNTMQELGLTHPTQYNEIESKLKRNLTIIPSDFKGDRRYIELLKKFNYKPFPISARKLSKKDCKIIREEVSLEEEELLSDLSQLEDKFESMDEFDDI